MTRTVDHLSNSSLPQSMPARTCVWLTMTKSIRQRWTSTMATTTLCFRCQFEPLFDHPEKDPHMSGATVRPELVSYLAAIDLFEEAIARAEAARDTRQRVEAVAGLQDLVEAMERAKARLPEPLTTEEAIGA